MARCEECIHYDACLTFMGVRIVLCDDKADERCKKFKPTADVAPRAEVDKAYWEGVEYGHKDGAALVAREIFEEIEKIIKGPFAVGFCMTASSFRQAISDYNEGIRKEILYYIAELKKKYTESEPPEGD